MASASCMTLLLRQVRGGESLAPASDLENARVLVQRAAFLNHFQRTLQIRQIRQVDFRRLDIGKAGRSTDGSTVATSGYS